jgi:hypothetical protein
MAGESELIAKGKAKYVAGVNRIGGSAKYFECGGRGGMKTATCLKEAKAKAGSAAAWGETWATAMA